MPPPAPPPRTPRNILSGGLGGLIAFGVVVVIGALVWFLVLKPDPVPANVDPPVSPTATLTDGPTGSPTVEPTDTAPPTVSPSPSPEDPTGQPQFSVNICRSIDEQANCVDPFQITEQGWFIPVDTPVFHTYMLGQDLNIGDQMELVYLNKATGQEQGRLTPTPAEGSGWAAWTTWELLEGRVWSAGTTVEMVAYYNGQPITGWTFPNEFTFQEGGAG